jgi:hypothetical protein
VLCLLNSCDPCNTCLKSSKPDKIAVLFNDPCRKCTYAETWLCFGILAQSMHALNTSWISRFCSVVWSSMWLSYSWCWFDLYDLSDHVALYMYDLFGHVDWFGKSSECVYSSGLVFLKICHRDCLLNGLVFLEFWHRYWWNVCLFKQFCFPQIIAPAYYLVNFRGKQIKPYRKLTC